MSSGSAKTFILGTMVLCSVAAIYKDKSFNPRRITSIAILGAALLFLATFAPQVAGAGAALILADTFVLEPDNLSVIDNLGAVALPGASAGKAGLTAPPLGPMGPPAPPSKAQIIKRLEGSL